MHAVSLLITWISFRNSWSRDEIPVLIQFEQVEMNQKRVFEDFIITWLSKVRNIAFDTPWFVRSGPKAECRHVTMNFEEKFRWIKSEMACICVTWQLPSYSLQDQKLDHRVARKLYYKTFLDSSVFNRRFELLRCFIIEFANTSFFLYLGTRTVLIYGPMNFWSHIILNSEINSAV